MILLHPAFLRGIVVRSAIIWLGVRGLLLFAALLIPSIPALLIPSIPAALAVVALTAGLTAIDGRQHSETVLLANLGVPEWHLVLLAMLPPAVFEAVIQALT